MGIFDRFPYSSTHEMNLDFMLGKATEIAESLQEVQDGLSDIDTHKAQAEQAAQAAHASQAAASASAGQAAQHKTDAEDAADRAEAASTEAETAADRAETALGNMTDSESVCQEAAEEAQQYAQASQSHSNQAMLYKNDAETAKNNAAVSASQASISAGSAANSATDAASSANSANVSATNASLHASNAETSATNAATSATNAATSATNAASSASSAAASKEQVDTLVESLPEDFTALNNKVNNLENAFDTEIDLIRDGLAEETISYPTLTLTTGRYIAADGAISEIGNAGYKVTNYIPVSGFNSTDITGSANTNLLICAFYDESQVFISGIYGIDTVEENKSVYIPENASYMVIAADSRTTPACTLYNWSYDFVEKYENGYVRSVTRWKAGNFDTAGQEIYNAHPAITVGYLSTEDYNYIRRSDSYSEGQIYYYTYNEADATYTYALSVQVPIGVNYVIDKSYTHFRLRLFNGWSNTIDIAIASQTFGLYNYKTFATRPVWFGKKWAAIGDSLTEFNSTASIKYHAIISQQNGITVVNLGDGGTGYKATDNGNGDSFMDRVAKVPLDADVITIFGSGNDLGAENEIGTPTDTGTDTLCGCINTTIDNLFARMPLANLGIVTPTPWQQYNPANSQNKMALYAAAIVEICKNRGIPCLDLYHCSSLRPWDTTFKSLAYANADGVHPNNIGHALIAPKFQTFIDSLLIH